MMNRGRTGHSDDINSPVKISISEAVSGQPLSPCKSMHCCYDMVLLVSHFVWADSTPRIIKGGNTFLAKFYTQSIKYLEKTRWLTS